jgi:ATP-dependent 26S proteasome regulatory subunit
MPRVFCYYTMNNGLVFPSPESRGVWENMMKEYYTGMDGDQLNAILNPSNDIMEVLRTLNYTFEASKGIVAANRTGKGRLRQEHKFTVAFFNGNYIFPQGQILYLQGDRSPIGYVYNWAQDAALADRNRIIILTPGLDDIHETIRGGDSGVSAILIKRPNLDEREAWLNNFAGQISKLPENSKPFVGGKRRGEILFAPDMTSIEGIAPTHVMSVQTAGLNLRQMEQVIRSSWRNDAPIDFQIIRQHKQRAIEEAFGGLVDFIEPEYGFDVVGGHENLKTYAMRKIIRPLQRGDKRTCSKGVIWSGPPGTGKSFLATAVAKESRMNFLVGHLDRLFGGVVGETEGKTRKFLAAVDSSAPCILFLDELDSVLSSGRSSPGDSGTSARVFNSLMTFLSDDSRAGRVVVIAATNRPDLLDAALIRSGRFDAILPALPPNPAAANCAKARSEILKALGKKHRVKFARDLAATVRSTDAGLGRLFNDDKVWTGAEIEVVLKEAMDNCFFEGREVISQADWDDAMNSVMPNTRDVELQIDLALLYVNNMKYCPAEWADKARSKGELKANIKTVLSEGSFDREA